MSVWRVACSSRRRRGSGWSMESRSCRYLSIRPASFSESSGAFQGIFNSLEPQEIGFSLTDVLPEVRIPFCQRDAVIEITPCAGDAFTELLDGAGPSLQPLP